MGCLLIIGDNGPTLQDTCDTLRHYGFEVDACASIAQALALRRDYLLVILDCRNGAEASLSCSYLRQNGGVSCIVVVAPSEREDDQLRIFEAGADDVVSGAVSNRLLAERIKAHARRLGEARRSGTLPVVTASVQDGVEPNAGTELTRIEGRLFACLRAAAGALVTREALYKAGWPNNEKVMPQTLYVHMSALRRKLTPSGWSLHAVGGIGRGGYCLRLQQEPSLPSRRDRS